MLARLRRFERPFLITLLVASIGLSVFLSRQLRLIASGPRPTMYVTAGTVLPPLQLTDPEGEPFVLDFGDTSQPTILYVTTTNCIPCEANAKHFDALVRQTSGRYRAISIKAAGAQGQPARPMQVHSRLVVQPDVPEYVATDSAMNELRATTFPATIVANSYGVVLSAWVGNYEIRRKDIETFFFVTLPVAGTRADGDSDRESRDDSPEPRRVQRTVETPLQSLLGMWHNSAPVDDIASLTIELREGIPFVVLGKGQPGSEAKLYSTTVSKSARESIGALMWTPSSRRFIVEPLASNELELTMFTDFSDGRQSYVSRWRFRRKP